ncbi:hypothetical protein PYCC9005_005638 [Savitreella phatthalungensis]
MSSINVSTISNAIAQANLATVAATAAAVAQAKAQGVSCKVIARQVQHMAAKSQSKIPIKAEPMPIKQQPQQQKRPYRSTFTELFDNAELAVAAANTLSLPPILAYQPDNITPKLSAAVRRSAELDPRSVPPILLIGDNAYLRPRPAKQTSKLPKLKGTTRPIKVMKVATTNPEGRRVPPGMQFATCNARTPETVKSTDGGVQRETSVAYLIRMEKPRARTPFGKALLAKIKSKVVCAFARKPAVYRAPRDGEKVQKLSKRMIKVMSRDQVANHNELLLDQEVRQANERRERRRQKQAASFWTASPGMY